MKTVFAAAAMAVLSVLALSSSAFAQTKSAKTCQDEWRANKAAMQKAGKTAKAYVAECRAGTTAAQPTTTTAPSTPAPTPTAIPAKPVAPAAVPARPAEAPSGAGQYATEAEAKAHCPSDMVVWANLSSKIFHFSSSKSYGKTKKGAYMCEKEATSGGIRASKNEKRPAGV